MTEQFTAEIEVGGLAHLDLRVQVPAAVVSATYTRVLQGMRRRVQVDGYRVGKAPLSAVRKQVGDHLGQLVATQLVKDNADKAARAQGLPPLEDRAEAYAENEVVEGQGFAFRVRLNNIRARVTKLHPSYNNLELYVPPLHEDYEETIDKQLQLFLCQHAESRVRNDGEQVEEGDRVIFSCTAIDDQQPQPEELQNGKEQTIIIGVDDDLPGEIKRSLQGMDCGGTRRISRILKRRDSWGSEQLDGQKITFDLKAHKVEQLLLPELTDEFVQQKLGNVPSVEALRSKIQQEMVDKESRDRDFWLENKVEEELLSRSEVEIPQLLLDRITDLIYRKQTHDTDPDPQQQKELKQECLEQAEEIISTAAVLEEIARREKITMHLKAVGMVADQYRDLRRVVIQYLISKATIEGGDDEDTDEDESDAELDRKVDEDLERVRALRDKLNKCSQLKKLANYKGLSIEFPVTDSRNEAIERLIEALRYEHASYRLSAKPFTLGHDQRGVVTRFVTVDEELVPEMTLLHSFLSLPPQDTEPPPHEQVFIGMRAGERKEVLCPELFPVAAEQGHKVEITAVMDEVQELNLPTLDDQFAREFFDVESLAALRVEIGQEIEASQQDLLLERIFDKLIDESEFQIDTKIMEEVLETIFNSEVLRENFRVGKWLDTKDKRAILLDTIMRSEQRRVVTAEIARRENIADDPSTNAEEERLHKAEVFLLKEVKVVDCPSDKTRGS